MITKGLNKLFIVVGILCLVGCSSTYERPNTMDEMVSFLDDSEQYNRKISSSRSKAPPLMITESLVPGLDISLNPIKNIKNED